MIADFVVISQARMTSTRLPGKVLRTVLGKSLLEYQIERVRRARRISKLVIATTTNSQDEPIVALCENLKVSCFRGSELDVLSRYHGASQGNPSRHVIRITSDCPLLDPAVLDLAIEQYLDSRADYVSNSEAYPNGMNVEIFRREMLDEAFHQAQLPYEREHVTPYFYTHPEKFVWRQVQAPRSYPKYRLTVDTPEDFELVKALIERLAPRQREFTLEDICHEMEIDPGLAEINQHVRQKKFNE